ncbi:hypothetical protein GGR50DRAFT_518923 [Xylaria sp. CBS 124048]|nr:hypothetical protein GGR50DRAFT_518923 [Xylaria sp. CBS 124048]
MLVPVLVPVNILLWLSIIWLNELGRITIHYIVYPMQMKSHCSVANPAASTKSPRDGPWIHSPECPDRVILALQFHPDHTERSIISMKLS